MQFLNETGQKFRMHTSSNSQKPQYKYYEDHKTQQLSDCAQPWTAKTALALPECYLADWMSHMLLLKLGGNSQQPTSSSNGSPDRLVWHGSSHLGWGAVTADTPGCGGAISWGRPIGQGGWTIVAVTRRGLSTPFGRGYQALHSSQVQQLHYKQTVGSDWPSREWGARQK